MSLRKTSKKVSILLNACLISAVCMDFCAYGASDPAGSNNYTIYGETTFEPGTDVTLGNGNVTANGKIIAKTDVKLTGNLTTATKTVNTSDDLKTLNGVYHNYKTLTITNGDISGAVIINHAAAVEDNMHGKEAEGEGTISTGKQLVAGTTSSDDEISSTEATNAAYYDLMYTKGTGVQKFYTVNAAEVKNSGETVTGDNIVTSHEFTLTDAKDDEGSTGKCAYDLRSLSGQGSATRMLEINKTAGETNITGSLFSISGFGSTENVSSFTIGGENYYLPQVDTNLTITDKVAETAQAAKATYEDDIRTNWGSYNFAGWDVTKDPVTIWSGDNSWYNGVYHLTQGGAIIESAGKIFGGKVVVGTQGIGDPLGEITSDGSDNTNIAQVLTNSNNVSTIAKGYFTYFGKNDDSLETYINGSATEIANEIVREGLIQQDELVVDGVPPTYVTTIYVKDIIATIYALRNNGAELPKIIPSNATPTELEWKGGAKDPYNRPEIVLNPYSALYFNIDGDPEGIGSPPDDNIFSFYGTLSGDENSRIVFEKGTVYIKGDCSGFKGDVAIVQGSKFFVKNNNGEGEAATDGYSYEGKFPQANIHIIDDKGQEVSAAEGLTKGEATEIDTNGLENYKAMSGYTKVYNGDKTSASTVAPSGSKGGSGAAESGTITLSEFAIEKNALVEVDGKAVLESLTVKGYLKAHDVTSAKGLTLQGGVLETTKGVAVAGDTKAASTLVTWGNNSTIDSLSINNDFEVIDGHTLKLFSDYSFSKEGTGYYQSDKIEVDGVVADSGALSIAGMNFLSDPMEDTYTYEVLQNAGGNLGGLTKVQFGADYNTFNPGGQKFVAYQNGQFTTTSAGFEAVANGQYRGDDLPYTFKATGGTQLGVTEQDGVYRIGFNNGKYYELRGNSDETGNLIVEMHLVDGPFGTITSGVDVIPELAYGLGATSSAFAVGDTVSDIDDLFDVIDERESSQAVQSWEPENTGELNNRWGKTAEKTIKRAKRFKIWDKAFGEHSKIDLKKIDKDVQTNAVGDVIGLDLPTYRLKNGWAVLIPTVFGGIHHQHLKCETEKGRSDGYFVGLKGALLTQRHGLELYGFYEAMRTKMKTSNTGDSKVKGNTYSLGAKYGFNIDFKSGFTLRPTLFAGHALLTTSSFDVGSTKRKLGHVNKFEVAPGISIGKKFDQWNAKAFASYHQRFGGKIKTQMSGVKYDIDFAKKKFMEYGVEVNRYNQQQTAKISLKLSRKDFGVKGFKATISAGTKF